jgi:hypothetical protein
VTRHRWERRASVMECGAAGPGPDGKPDPFCNLAA